jgi:hypothetical protein
MKTRQGGVEMARRRDVLRRGLDDGKGGTGGWAVGWNCRGATRLLKDITSPMPARLLEMAIPKLPKLEIVHSLIETTCQVVGCKGCSYWHYKEGRVDYYINDIPVTREEFDKKSHEIDQLIKERPYWLYGSKDR